VLAVDWSGAVIESIGVFLSGIGTVVTGWLALRYEAKRSDRNCKERIEAYMTGIRMREEMLKSDSGVLRDKPNE
jgi:hypothetical protein